MVTYKPTKRISSTDEGWKGLDWEEKIWLERGFKSGWIASVFAFQVPKIIPGSKNSK